MEREKWIIDDIKDTKALEKNNKVHWKVSYF